MKPVVPKENVDFMAFQILTKKKSKGKKTKENTSKY